MYCIIRRNPKTCKERIDSDDEIPTEIDEIPFVPAYLRDNRFDVTGEENVEFDFLSTATVYSPNQQFDVPSEVRSSVDSRVTRPKTCKDIIDSDDELPTEIDEIPFVSAYLRDNRFDVTEEEKVELDFLGTATDDSPDQQLDVPSEVRCSVYSRVTRPKTCKDIIDSDDEIPTEIDEIPFVPAYLRDNRFDVTEEENVELDFLSTATDDSPDLQLNVPSEVRSSVESLSSLTTNDSSDESSCWCDSPCGVRRNFEFLTTNDSSDQQLNVSSEVGTSRRWVFGNKVAAVGVFKFGTSELEPESESESEVVAEE